MNTSQYTPLKHFIYEDRLFLVILYSLNYEHNMEIQIKEMDKNEDRFDDDRYGHSLHYIEKDGACDVEEGVEVSPRINEALVVRTYDSWYTIPIKIMEFAIEAAKWSLLRDVGSKTEWLNYYIDTLKIFKKSMEKEGISRIINHIEIQITEYEAELAKISG